MHNYVRLLALLFTALWCYHVVSCSAKMLSQLPTDVDQLFIQRRALQAAAIVVAMATTTSLRLHCQHSVLINQSIHPPIHTRKLCYRKDDRAMRAI